MCENICNIQITTLATYVEKKMKYWERKLETCVYNHCNICNNPIYFCNIHLNHLQHASDPSETLEMYAYNMCFSPFFHAT